MEDIGKILLAKIDELEPEDNLQDNDYSFLEYNLTNDDTARHCNVSFYRLPPGKANYPYHYHIDQEEVFYIISGNGILKTPEGERRVSAGDLVFFPTGPGGAHKLTNASDKEELVYIDFDSKAYMDVAVYPDSEKIGIWGAGVNKVFRLKDRASYYEGEE